MDKHYKVPEAILNGVLAILSKLPYDQTHHIIHQLQAAAELIQPEIKPQEINPSS